MLTNYLYPEVYSSPGDGYDTAVVVSDQESVLLFVSGLLPPGEDVKYLQVFDSDTIPSEGDQPLLSIPVAPTDDLPGYFEFRPPLHGLAMTNGLVVVSSDAAARYSADSDSGIFITCLFIER